jgi:CelD/BcsL family acetyltransferase involved in cellulose biosynthesis
MSVLNSGQIQVQAEQGGAEIIERLAPEWRELCEEESNDDPAYRPEWIEAYLSAYAPKATALVVAARVGGRLKAVLPMVWDRIRLRGLPVKGLTTLPRFTTTRLDLVQSAGPEGEAAGTAVWEHLRGLPGWQILQLGGVQPATPLEKLVCRAQADGYATGSLDMSPDPYVPIPSNGSNSARVEPRSKGQRAVVRKLMRELGTPGRLQLVRIEGADPEALQRFYKLESSGWKGREKSAILFVPEAQQFFSRIADAAGRFGYLTLYELYLDGHHVAGHFGLTYRGRYFSPKGAIDEKYAEYSPGHLITQLILQDCAQRGISAFDFLGGAADWKMLWTSHVRERRIWFIFRRGVVGHLLHTMEFWAKPAVKKLLGREARG